MSLKVGDKVMLREDSKWNDGGLGNPVGVVGEIKEICNGKLLPVRVCWSSRYNNEYEEKDLYIVPEGVPENPWEENPLYFGYTAQWEPEKHEMVYTINFSLIDPVWGMCWTGTGYQKNLLDRGLVFQSEQEARAKVEKMLGV